MNSPQLQRGIFLALLAAVSIAFAWILLPFAGAILWGAALAILFTPLYRRLLRHIPRHPTTAALLTLTICLVIVIIPLSIVAVSLVQEIGLVTQNVRSGQINFAAYLQRILAALPQWMHNLIDHFDLGDVGAWQTRIASTVAQASQLIVSKVVVIGQNTFEFVVSFCVMLYLLFFLLRDGTRLSATIREAMPLSQAHAHRLLEKFTTVIRATVKGNIAIAATQGVLGGIAFWALGVQGTLLWATLMGFLSLLPAVGASLIWLPVALYFLATGAIWQGLFLIVFGVLVISMVDNVLRPILVGKDTQMPDYVVLTSTIGGIATLGINGFVIGPVVAALFMAAWDLFTASSHSGETGDSSLP